MKPSKIRITCQAVSTLSPQYVSELQGDLKTLTKENYQRLKNVIIKFGFCEPISVWYECDGSGERTQAWILNGHQRIRTVLEMISEGWECPDLPVNVVEAADINEARKIILALASQYGDVDADGLYKFIQDTDITVDDMMTDYHFADLNIPDFITGYMDDEDKSESDPEKDDAVPDTEGNVFNVERGQIWKLGQHRIMCGDSTDKGDVALLMDGQKADMVFTSPPYNAAKDSFLNDSPVKGFDKKYAEHTDDFSDADYAEFLIKFTNISLEVADYVFVNLQLLSNNRIPVIEYQSHFKEKIKDILIWNKKICPPNIVKGAFNTKWEYLFCFSDDRKTRGFPVEWRGQFPNVIETESNSANEFASDHKAGFPVAFPLWIIEKMDFAESVYDPFMGTGTTLIACEKTNRKCFGMELDPHYCSIIINRWQEFTGQTAERIK